MHWRFQFLVGGALMLLVIVALRQYAGNNAIETALEPTSAATASPRPLLKSSTPLRSLGTSEFRLPRRGNDPLFQFSTDSKLLAACSWEEVKVWTFPDGRIKHDFSNDVDSDCVAFSPSGRELLVLDQRNENKLSIVRFDLASGERLRENVLEPVRQEGATYYTFLDNGRYVCSIDIRSKLSVWTADTGRLVIVKPSVQANRHPVASDGVLMLGGDHVVERIDLRTGNTLTRFKIYNERINPIFTPDGSLMAGYSKKDAAVVFWKTATDEIVGGKIPMGEREWNPSEAVLSADGKRLVYWSGTNYVEREVTIFDVDAGEVVTKFSPPDVYYLHEPIISPDGKWIVLTGQRSVLTPVSTTTGKPFRQSSEHVNEIAALSFTPDGSTLIVGSRDKRQAWNVKTGESGTVFQAFYHSPYVVAVDDQRVLVTGLPVGGVQLQSIENGAVERIFDLGKWRHLADFELGADRKSFTGLVESTYKRWKIDTGELIAELTIPKQRHGREMQQFRRYSFGRLVLGGSRLCRFDQVQPVKKLPDGNIERGAYDLLLEDWTTQRVTNRLPLSCTDNFSIANMVDDRTLAVVTADDDWHERASKRMDTASTYLLVWDVNTGWERLRVTLPRPSYHDAFSSAAMTPDVRIVATARNKMSLEIWNGFTGDLLQRFKAPVDVTELALSEDGKTLASGHLDGSVYLWDTSTAWKAAVPGLDLAPVELQQCWEELAGDDAAKAMQRLLGDPEDAVKMLAENLRPAKEVRSLPGILSSENADAGIQELGRQSLDGLYEALEHADSDEKRDAINRLIKIAQSPVIPSLRRRLLAVRIVESINSPESKSLLRKWSAGEANDPVTNAAFAACNRLGLTLSR